MSLWATRLARLGALMALAAILILLLRPVTAAEQSWPEGADKLVHAIAFSVVFWSLAILLPGVSRWRLASLGVVLGAATELVQGMVGRDAELGDAFADAIGMGSAYLIWIIWRAVGRQG